MSSAMVQPAGLRAQERSGLVLSSSFAAGSTDSLYYRKGDFYWNERRRVWLSFSKNNDTNERFKHVKDGEGNTPREREVHDRLRGLLNVDGSCRHPFPRFSQPVPLSSTEERLPLQNEDARTGMKDTFRWQLVTAAQVEQGAATRRTWSGCIPTTMRAARSSAAYRVHTRSARSARHAAANV